MINPGRRGLAKTLCAGMGQAEQQDQNRLFHG